MKLALKLLAAPLLTAVVVFSAGQVNAFLLGDEVQANQAAFKAQMEDFQTLTSVQDQLAQLHAGVYRTVALIASMDEPRIKAYRAQLALQLAGVKRTVAAVVDAEDHDPVLLDAVAQLGKQVDKYASQADAAVDLASVDPNTGIAAMQGADTTFAALAKTMATAVARVEALSSEAMAASSQRSRQAAWLLGASGVLSAALAVLLSWMMQRKLTAELQRAADIAGQVAAGNLVVDARSERRDEVGDLVRALAARIEWEDSSTSRNELPS